VKEKISIRFVGGGVSPDTIDARDVAVLIQKFCDSTRAIADNAHSGPAVGILVNLYEIQNQSLGIGFLARSAAALSACTFFLTAVATGFIGDLPESSQDFAKAVRRFSAENKCKAEFYIRQTTEPVVVIDEFTEFRTETSAPLTGVVKILGRLERIGGAVPRAIILTLNDERVSCILTEDQALALRTKLYEFVALECETAWTWSARKGPEFKVRKIVSIPSHSAESAFDALSESLRTPFLDMPLEDDE
jgi:hypothetical protein